MFDLQTVQNTLMVTLLMLLQEEWDGEEIILKVLPFPMLTLSEIILGELPSKMWSSNFVILKEWISGMQSSKMFEWNYQTIKRFPLEMQQLRIALLSEQGYLRWTLVEPKS